MTGNLPLQDMNQDEPSNLPNQDEPTALLEDSFVPLKSQPIPQRVNGAACLSKSTNGLSSVHKTTNKQAELCNFNSKILDNTLMARIVLSFSVSLFLKTHTLE